MIDLHGTQSEEAMENRSQAFDTVRNITNDAETALTGEQISSHGATEAKWVTDVSNCAKILLQNEVFVNKGARFYPGFENFQYTSPFIDNIVRFREQINNLSKNLDSIQECLDLKVAANKN